MDRTLRYSTLLSEFFILAYEALSFVPAQAQETCNIQADPIPVGCELYTTDSKNDADTVCDVGPIPKNIESCHRVVKCLNDRHINQGYDTCFYYGYDSSGTMIPAAGTETTVNVHCRDGILIVAPNSLFGIHTNRDECSPNHL